MEKPDQKQCCSKVKQRWTEGQQLWLAQALQPVGDWPSRWSFKERKHFMDEAEIEFKDDSTLKCAGATHVLICGYTDP